MQVSNGAFQGLFRLKEFVMLLHERPFLPRADADPALSKKAGRDHMRRHIQERERYGR
ncbi:hypothetical protein [Mesorhizobium sp.]|uniref:hypothetical protein n=1 Tax=Mesorhizobium sp. TaxID=1871066 RepID=UPI0025D961EE|nr:hypothetical protein [Mesorhizobium sp.]